MVIHSPGVIHGKADSVWIDGLQMPKWICYDLCVFRLQQPANNNSSKICTRNPATSLASGQNTTLFKLPKTKQARTEKKNKATSMNHSNHSNHS
jgi:hypothetical protein